MHKDCLHICNIFLLLNANVKQCCRLTQLGAPPLLLLLLLLLLLFVEPGPSQPMCATCFTSVGNPICISASLPSCGRSSVWKRNDEVNVTPMLWKKINSRSVKKVSVLNWAYIYPWWLRYSGTASGSPSSSLCPCCFFSKPCLLIIWMWWLHALFLDSKNADQINRKKIQWNYTIHQKEKKRMVYIPIRCCKYV